MTNLLESLVLYPRETDHEIFARRGYSAEVTNQVIAAALTDPVFGAEKRARLSKALIGACALSPDAIARLAELQPRESLPAGEWQRLAEVACGSMSKPAFDRFREWLTSRQELCRTIGGHLIGRIADQR